MMEKDTMPRSDTGTEQGGAFSTPADSSWLGTAAGSQASPDHLVDTNAEEAYWRQNYSSRPYVSDGTSFIEYRPAFRYGADAHSRYQGKSFEQVEPEMASEWDRIKGTSSLTWDDAKHAVRDAWQRVGDVLERAMPGDSDNDGK